MIAVRDEMETNMEEKKLKETCVRAELQRGRESYVEQERR